MGQNARVDIDINPFNQLCAEAKAGCTAQGLTIEKVFLAKLWADKGIKASTFEEEIARIRHCGDNGRAVAGAPPMDAAAVQGKFDD